MVSPTELENACKVLDKDFNHLLEALCDFEGVIKNAKFCLCSRAAKRYEEKHHLNNDYLFNKALTVLTEKGAWYEENKILERWMKYIASTRESVASANLGTLFNLVMCRPSNDNLNIKNGGKATTTAEWIGHWADTYGYELRPSNLRNGSIREVLFYVKQRINEILAEYGRFVDCSEAFSRKIEELLNAIDDEEKANDEEFNRLFNNTTKPKRYRVSISITEV